MSDRIGVFRTQIGNIRCNEFIPLYGVAHLTFCCIALFRDLPTRTSETLYDMMNRHVWSKVVLLTEQ